MLNTATEHVVVNPEKYPAYDIKYHGFHVDNLPEANISRYKLTFLPSTCKLVISTYIKMIVFYSLSRYFHTTTKFIDQAVSSGGLIVVNCVMGWSRFDRIT